MPPFGLVKAVLKRATCCPGANVAVLGTDTIVNKFNEACYKTHTLNSRLPLDFYVHDRLQIGGHRRTRETSHRHQVLAGKTATSIFNGFTRTACHVTHANKYGGFTQQSSAQMPCVLCEQCVRWEWPHLTHVKQIAKTSSCPKSRHLPWVVSATCTGSRATQSLDCKEAKNGVVAITTMTYMQADSQPETKILAD